MSWEAVNEFSKRYGAYAFGTVVLLLVWAMVFRPLLADKQASMERFSEISQSLNTASANLKDATQAQARIAEAQAATAAILDRSVARLERLSENLRANSP
jgi:F0F1-type ATP synthase membrane subunit b/b'